MEEVDLSALFLHFLALWFVAVGGPSTILPEIHRYVVEVHHWMTSAQFVEVYALAQVAPGPNVMYVTLIGWHLAGGRAQPRPRSRFSYRLSLLRFLSGT
jgi:chromate transporter